MKKSKISPADREFTQKPYSKIPKRVEKRVHPQDFVAADEAPLRHDGKQFALRIPLKISRALELDKNKRYVLQFTVRKPPFGSEGKPTVTIEFGEK